MTKTEPRVTYSELQDLPWSRHRYYELFDGELITHNSRTRSRTVFPPALAIDMLEPPGHEPDLRRLTAYARAGLPWYWIVDSEVPSCTMTMAMYDETTDASHPPVHHEEVNEAMSPAKPDDPRYKNLPPENPTKQDLVQQGLVGTTNVVDDIQKTVHRLEIGQAVLTKGQEELKGGQRELQHKLVGIDRQLNGMNTRIDKVDQRIDKVDTRVDKVERRMDQRFDMVDQRLVEVDKRFDMVDQRLVEVDQRFDMVDQRLVEVDKRFDRIDQRFDGHDKQFKAVNGRLDGIDGKLEVLVGIMKSK